MLKDNGLEKRTVSQCSFCGKHRDQVKELTIGPGETAICDECVASYRNRLEAGEGEAVFVRKPLRACSFCGTNCPESYNYCFNCGAQLT